MSREEKPILRDCEPSVRFSYKKPKNGYKYKIEKGIPKHAPNNIGRGTDYAIYPWPEMEPGDSFLVPDKPAPILQMAVQSQYRLHPDDGRLYSVRTVVGGVRVWRDK